MNVKSLKGASCELGFQAFRRTNKVLVIFLTLMLALGGQPLLSPVLADGYYDEDGNWVEDTGSYGSGGDPWLMDTDGDGIVDGEELSGFNIEREVTEQMPYSYPVYNPDTGEGTWETGTTQTNSASGNTELIGLEPGRTTVTAKFFSGNVQIDTAEGEVVLLPVEILVPKEDSTSTGYASNDLVSTDKLKVAKWERAFEGSSQSPTLKQNFNEGDIDRFYLRVPMPWKEGEGTVRVKIKTDSDPENEIEVTEIPGQPGVFRTKGLILVADDVDDAYPPNTDEQLDDVTYKVKLGDKVTFRIPTPSGGFSEVSADVPTRGVLSLAVWHVPTTWNEIAVRSKPEVDKAVERIKEAYAQAGIKVDASIKTENWPESVRQLQAGMTL